MYCPPIKLWSFRKNQKREYDWGGLGILPREIRSLDCRKCNLGLFQIWTSSTKWGGKYWLWGDIYPDVNQVSSNFHGRRLPLFLAGGYDKNNKKHHQLLMSLLMTSCDLSDQTKNWRKSKKIAVSLNSSYNQNILWNNTISTCLDILLVKQELVYREFFSQGDLEKAMGNRPLEMMDRERACIPELQIAFIQEILEPVYLYVCCSGYCIHFCSYLATKWFSK